MLVYLLLSRIALKKRLGGVQQNVVGGWGTDQGRNQVWCRSRNFSFEGTLELWRGSSCY